MYPPSCSSKSPATSVPCRLLLFHVAMTLYIFRWGSFEFFFFLGSKWLILLCIFFLYFQSVHNQCFVIKNHIYRCHHRALLDGTRAPGCCCLWAPDSSAVRQRVMWNWKGVARSNRARESGEAETGGVGLIWKERSGEGDGWFAVALRDATRSSSAHRLAGGANLRWLLKLKHMWLTSLFG